MSDLRSAILACDDRPYEDVEEWGQPLRIRGLDGAGAERFSLYVEAAGDGVPSNMMAHLLVLCLEDPATGERIFTDDDVDELARKSGLTLGKLFRIARRLSGLGDLDDAKND